MLIPTLLLVLVSSCYSSSLQFIIHQRKTECFYLEKEKGEMLEAWFEVADGRSQISFAVFDTKDQIIHQESTVLTSNINMEVNVTGDYALCFSGQSLASSVNVFFDFDPEVQNTIKEDINQKLSAEKRIFLSRILHNIRYDEKYQDKKFNLTEQFMMDVVRHHKNDLVDQNPNVGVENSLLYLSILADRMSSYMDKHKVQMRRHHYLQEANRWNVNIFSSIISLIIIISAWIQLIVLKSFFTGFISFKVWQF